MITALVLTAVLFSNQEVRTFEILNPEVYLGDTVVIRMNAFYRIPMTCISAFGKHYFPDDHGYVYIGINLSVKPGKERIFRVECGRGTEYGLDSYFGEITIKQKEFSKTRNIRPGRPNDEPCSESRLQAIREAYNPLAMAMPDLTGAQTYLDPTDKERKISHPYGFIYASSPNFPHCGVDLPMPVGTRVKSVNRGIVVLTGRYRAEGNMIIINHGRGIFSVYLHLSRISVKAGQNIEKGQIIGLSGVTGAGAGIEPHLHFNIRIHDGYIDPFIFIDTVNDKWGK